MPVYLRTFEPGERLIQHVSNSKSSGVPETGNYFGLPGEQSMGELGIGSGLSGRTLREFSVERTFVTLEGTTAAIDEKTANKSGLSIRGQGGATQIFIPDGGRSCLGPPRKIDFSSKNPNQPNNNTRQMHIENDRRKEKVNQAPTIASDSNDKKPPSLEGVSGPAAGKSLREKMQEMQKEQTRERGR
jgi:hypothetical protein